MQKLFFSKPICSAVLAGLSLLACQSSAALDMEEVLVTGDFRATNLMDAPISVSAFGAQEVNRRAATHMEEMLNTLPNVNFSAGSNRARFIQIRGIGERSQFTQPINPSVGVFIDGADFSGLGSAATLFDVEQVEVLRGPQGTRFGANALAGVVSLQSTAPSAEQPNRLEVNAGNYGSYGAALATGAPLDESGHLHARIALQTQQSDGYYHNAYLGRDDTNGRDENSARLRVRYANADDLMMDWVLTYVDADNGYDAFTLDNTRNTLSDQPGRDAQESLALSWATTWAASERFDVVSQLAWMDTDSEYSYDEDWAYPDLAAGTDFAGWEYASFDRYLRDQQRATLDLRLVSSEAGSVAGDTDWVVGVYGVDNQQDLHRQYTYLAADFFSHYDTQNLAIYGQLDTSLSDRLELSIGLRAEDWSADYIDSDGLKIRSDEGLWGAKLGLNYRTQDDALLFASLSRGYKPGGVNTDGTLPVTERDFATELLYNLELGYKAALLDKSLQTRVSAFYSKRRDQQVKGSYTVARDDGSTEFVDYIENAARGTNYGLEAEFDWQASESLELRGSLGLLHAEFNHYLAPATQADPEGLDLNGRQQAHAPEYQYNLEGRVALADGWRLDVGVEGKAAFYFSDRHSAKSDAYSLLNARLSYSSGAWQYAVWGRNLGDEDVAVRGFGSFGNDPRNGYEVGEYVQYGEPRVFGVSVNWQH